MWSHIEYHLLLLASRPYIHSLCSVDFFYLMIPAMCFVAIRVSNCVCVCVFGMVSCMHAWMNGVVWNEWMEEALWNARTNLLIKNSLWLSNPAALFRHNLHKQQLQSLQEITLYHTCTCPCRTVVLFYPHSLPSLARCSNVLSLLPK